MNPFTKKERIVIIIVVFIVIFTLGFKFFIKDMIKPGGLVVDLDNEEEMVFEDNEDLLREADEEENEIMVHISGQVYNPGIIILEPGKRLIDGIELAGGLKKEADLDRINLARKLSDEEKIYIPKIGEEVDLNIVEPTSTQSSGAGKVNINNCSKEELISLPGIGEVIAGRIIDYRTENPFKSIDDIKSVSGIGDKKFEGIKELIIVK